MNVISVDELSVADLQVDAIYQGGRKGNAGDDLCQSSCVSTARAASATAAK